jgi:hypothetical protein
MDGRKRVRNILIDEYISSFQISKRPATQVRGEVLSTLSVNFVDLTNYLE